MNNGFRIFLTAIAIIVITLLVSAILFFGATPEGRERYVAWKASLDKASEDSYANQKRVEDYCRAAISTYNADKLTYEQYKDSEDEEQRGWAAAAKIRANTTASTYNNYMQENSFVWEDNLPDDIPSTLSVIE